MAESTVVYARTSSGSVRGVEGGVEKLLNAFRKKEGPLGNCRKLQRLEEEEAPDSTSGRKGKVVVYITSIRAVQETHKRCDQVVHILRAHKISFTIKDIFLHPDYGKELCERLGCPSATSISLPQLFIAGENIGGWETILEANEVGKLKEMLDNFKIQGSGCLPAECQFCGGKGFVLCLWCKGSKKGMETAFGDLKCTVCNQNGLQKCPECVTCREP